MKPRVLCAALAVVAALGLAACSGEPVIEGTPRSAVPLGLPSDSVVSLAAMEPDDGVSPVLDFINDAQETLDIAVYQMDPGYDALINALLAAQARGVKVRVLLSGTVYPPTAANGNPGDAQRLRDLGIDTQLSRPEFSFSHWKVLISDGATARGRALICDFNLEAGYFGLNPDYPDEGDTRGMAVLDTDPTDVKMIQRTFDADWPPYKPWPANDSPRLVWSPSDDTCDSPSCTAPAPLVPVGNSRRALTDLLNSATSTLDIFVQAFAYPSELLQPVLDACVSGVAVRVVGNEGGINDEVLRSLAACGAEVRWNTSDPTGDGRIMYIHSKTIVVDAGLPSGVAFVGSVNPFLDESVQTERELGVLVTDPGSISQIESVFDRDFTAGSPA